MAVLLPLLSILEDHFFSSVDHFLLSSEICELVGVVTFDVTSFRVVPVSFSNAVVYDLCDLPDFSDVILFVLVTIFDPIFDGSFCSSFNVLSWEGFLKSFAPSTSLAALVKLLVLSTLEDELLIALLPIVFFEDKLEREDLFKDSMLDSIDGGSDAAVFTDNEEVDETGASSRELLLDDKHEYDLMFAGFIRLVEPERAPARES